MGERKKGWEEEINKAEEKEKKGEPHEPIFGSAQPRAAFEIRH